jgi:tetratricopeptide (TPR) repeat protein
MAQSEPFPDLKNTVMQGHKLLPDQSDLPQSEQTTKQMEPHTLTVSTEVPQIPGYRITAEIARGGMGQVYAGYDLTLGREVAIKMLLPRANAERFITEAKITAQLPHPGIPPVYTLGTLEDGTPWLAMKLIRGRTLAELLKKRSSPSEELPRFIQIFEQIAQAVGFAHSRGIIHRDLKPLNVMVGEFGEVQVMDWGLAKVLTPVRHGKGASPVEPGGTLGLEPGVDMDMSVWGDSATQAGSVLGTPAYMPPEQARGEIERMDARSDVFGLGAILCQILTGHPPYRSLRGIDDVDDVLRQAARWEVGEAFAALDSCGAEPELVALCKRCLAREQADRPADGGAVAAEVARIRQAAEERARQTELERQRALVREAEQAERRRLAIVAASSLVAVLLAGLAVSLWQMNRAMDAERQAVANAELARENERQAMANAELARANEAKALAERDAKAAALKAEEIARQQAVLAAEKEKAARLAEKEARDRAMAALRVMTDELVERQLARSPTLTEENKEFLRKVIAQFEGFAAITANDADSRAIRGEGYFRVGLMRYRLGDLKEAEAAFRDALAIQKQLAADFPTRPDFRQQLARTYGNLGVLLRETGRLKEAEAVYRDALAIQKQLVAEFPTRPDFRQELTKSYNNLGVLLYQTGRPKEAEAVWRDALAIRQQLVADFPTRPDFRQQLASSHNNLGLLLYQTGRPKEAEAAWRDALAIRQQLVADFPTRPDFRQELASSHNNLGLLLYQTGRPKEAERAFRDALAIRQQLATEFPTRPDFRQELALCYNNLGNLLSDTGRLAEAEVAYRETLKLQQQLVTDFPTRPDFRQELAKSHSNLGILLYQTGRPKEAEAAFRETLKLQQQLATDFPTRPDFRQALARSHLNLGNLLSNTGRLKEAEAAYRETLKLQQQLATDFPNQLDIRYELAGTLVSLANLCNQRRDFAAAKGYLDEAAPHHRATLKVNPRHPDYRQFYRNNLWTLAQAQAGLLDRAAAVKVAEQIRDLGWNPADDAYHAACALALCIPIVEKHDKLNADERQAAVQFYGDEAMKLLRDAVAKGYKNAAQMKADRNLAPLRGRDDFQKLLAELEGKFEQPPVKNPLEGKSDKPPAKNPPPR